MVPADRVVFVIAQMFSDLLLECGLEHLLGQPGQQAVRADQVDAFGPCLSD